MERVPVDALRIDRPEFACRLLLGYSVAYVFAAWVTARLILAMPAPLLGATSFTYQMWYVFAFWATSRTSATR